MHSRQLDQVGSAASFCCAIHCALSPLVLPLLPLAAARIMGPTLEWGFLIITLIIGVLSLEHSYRVIHRDWRSLALFAIGFGTLGVVRLADPSAIAEMGGILASTTLIIAAHILNLRLRDAHARIACGCACHDDSPTDD